MEDQFFDTAQQWLALVYYARDWRDWCPQNSFEHQLWSEQYKFTVFKFNESMVQLTHVVSQETLQEAINLVMIKLS
jgi:hypothetical protein